MSMQSVALRKPVVRHWLWVTRPEYYLVDGRDRADLRRGGQFSYWTCAKGTRRGDLALLWRTTPRRDIGYLLVAEEDAFPLHRERSAAARGWRFGCPCRVLYKFRRPIGVAELRADPWLCKEWGSLRSNFQGRAMSVPPQVWQHLLKWMRRREGPAFSRALEQAGVRPLRVRREQEIENDLSSKPKKLCRIANDLALWEGEAGQFGRQLICPEIGGRIDLLFTTRSRRTLVVVELKVVRATRETFGQVTSYLGWVERHLARGAKVLGLVVAPDADAAFEACRRTNPRVKFASLESLGY